MKTKIGLVLTFILLFGFIQIGYCAQALNYSTDWQIGVFKLTDEFNLTQATTYLGEIKKINNEGFIAGATIRGVYFEKGFMSLRDNKIFSVATTVPNMSTPRYIEIGSTLNSIIEKYGLPTKTRANNKDNTCWYIYGTQGSEISFLIDNVTSKVIKLVVSFPVC